MYRAEISVILFKIVGIWPSKYSKGLLTIIYQVYSIFVVSLTFIFTASNLFFILSEKIEVDVFIEDLFYFLTLLVACIKMIVIFQKRNKIHELMKILHNKQFQPRDAVEFSIQEKFDKIGRFLYLLFLYLLIQKFLII